MPLQSRIHGLCPSVSSCLRFAAEIPAGLVALYPPRRTLPLAARCTEYDVNMSRIRQCLDADRSDRSSRSDVLLREEPNEEEDDEEDEGNGKEDDEDEDTDDGYSE